MNHYLVLFREPDGRTLPHTAEEIAVHQQSWQTWSEKWLPGGHLAGGSGLTLNGNIVRDGVTVKTIYRNGPEIVGGFLILKADSLEDATDIVSECPIFDFGGYAEVREMQVPPEG